MPDPAVSIATIRAALDGLEAGVKDALAEARTQRERAEQLEAQVGDYMDRGDWTIYRTEYEAFMRDRLRVEALTEALRDIEAHAANREFIIGNATIVERARAALALDPGEGQG